MISLDLETWNVVLEPGWDKHFRKFDKSVQQQIIKKLDQMGQPLASRGLKRSRYLAEEVGQYRIAFTEDSQSRTRKVYFIGDHKQYDKWCAECIGFKR